jgi:hypothetical protein
MGDVEENFKKSGLLRSLRGGNEKWLMGDVEENFKKSGLLRSLRVSGGNEKWLMGDVGGKNSV